MKARLFIKKDSPFEPTTNSANGRIFTQVEEKHQISPHIKNTIPSY